MKKAISLSLVSAAFTLAIGAASASAADEKCFGVSKAGENGCKNAAATHSCAGMSTMNYDGQDFKLVPAGTCMQMGGKMEPFEGMGTPVNPS